MNTVPKYKLRAHTVAVRNNPFYSKNSVMKQNIFVGRNSTEWIFSFSTIFPSFVHYFVIFLHLNYESVSYFVCLWRESVLCSI